MKQLIAFWLIFGMMDSMAFESKTELPDSIEISLNKLTSDSLKVRYLLDLSKSALRSNPTLNFQLLSRAALIAEITSNTYLLSEVKIKQGIHQLYEGKYDSARIKYQDVLDEAISKKDSLAMALAYSELGISYYYESNDSKALENFIKSYHLLVPLKDTLKLAGLSNNIGNVYRYLGEFEKALDFYRIALNHKIRLEDSVRLASSYHNLAVTLDEMGNEDSAIYYFNLAIPFRKKYNDLRGLAKSYVSLSEIFERSKKFDSAIFNINKALDIDLKMKDTLAWASDLRSKAQILFAKGDVKSAMWNAEKALNMANDTRVILSLHQILGDGYAILGNYKKSSLSRKEYIFLSDSIQKAEKTASLQELQVSFDTERKDAKIAQLAAENEIKSLQAEKEEQKQLALLMIALILIVIVFFLFLTARSKSASNKILDAKNQELANLNRTKDRLFSIISHDLKSPLSSFHTITQSLSDNWDLIEKEQLKDFIITLRDSSADVKNMMDNLLKWALAQTGELKYSPQQVSPSEIIGKVKSQLEPVSKIKKIDILEEITSHSSISADQQFLEIVIRNLLSNAVKFSKVESEIKVSTSSENEKEVISIQDFGVGMEQEEIDNLLKGSILAQDIQNSTEKGTGLGLTLCKELIQKMGAEMQVSSKKGKGTTFKLVFAKAA